MSGTAIGIVDTDVGPLLAPIDPWIWPCLVKDGRWEPTVGDVVREVVRPGSVVVNVGAHVGYFARMAALAGAQVIAYEPAPSNRRLLELNTAGLDVEIRPVAASDTSRVASLWLSADNPGDHRLAPHLDSTRSLPVKVTPLDAERLPPPDLVICDAQGEDLCILRGARQLLAEHHPHVLIEFTPHLLNASDFPEVDHLIANGYRARLVECDRMPVESAQHAADVLGAGTATMHLEPPRRDR